MLDFGALVAKTLRRDAHAFKLGAQVSLADETEIARLDQAALLTHFVEKTAGAVLTASVELGKRHPRRANRFANVSRLRDPAEPAEPTHESSHRAAWKVMIFVMRDIDGHKSAEPGFVIPMRASRIG